jgi:hypothetical protein
LICRSIHEVKLISRGLRSVIQIILTTMLASWIQLYRRVMARELAAFC